jgi:phosphoribosylanthranilate isomerase
VAEIARIAKRPVWKAVPVATSADVAGAGRYLGQGRADTILFDAKPPADPRALPGGNGLTFDWRILQGLSDQPYALAGGLTPQNVADAIRLVAPAIVDVSSGVESSPGEKSPELIHRFIKAAKAAKGA